MRKKSKKKINFKNKGYLVLNVLSIICSVFFLGLITKLNVLPTKYYLIVVSIILFVNLLIFFFLTKKNIKKKIKRIFSIVAIIFILLILLLSFYLYKTIGFFASLESDEYKIENYSVLVLKKSKYNKIKDIKGLNVGYYSNSAGYKSANKKLNDTVSIKLKKYDDLSSLGESLLNAKVESIVIEDSMKTMLEEELDGFGANIKVIYTFSIKTKIKSSAKDVNVTDKPFILYISGIDTFGEISSVSRSDVNIIMAINPKTKQVLLVSIPRDYYVQLRDTTGTRDKLTHAGLYGVEKSIGTIEDLLGIDINYYFKVNFTSVVDIVNTLGKINTYSDYTFTSEDGYKYLKGYNEMNGEQALSFARERHAFSDGDRQRGKDQQAVIEAIITKLSSKSIITKYNSLLDSVNGKFQTNMGTNKMTSLIKMQIKDLAKWTVTSFSLNGADGSEYTYSCGSQKLYVMLPYKDSITQAQELINSVIAGEKLEGSYIEYNGSTNVVVEPSRNKTTTEIKTETDENNGSKKTYIITVYDESKKLKSTEVVEEGSNYEPIAEQKENKKFLGWKILSTGKQAILTDISENISIYPEYENITISDEKSQNSETQTKNADEIEDSNLDTIPDSLRP